ncbi:strawberry notch C-terminal domain-containing protein, partial [bacterium]|nr:strawberry notch C-terminal domain-containing protein [bacterium]
KKMYNELARAWQVVLENIDEALEETGGSESSEAKRNARGQFWRAQQMFFSQVLTTLPVPTLIKHMEKQLETKNSCILQLYNTNEALADRRIAQAEEADLGLEDIDLTPRDILMQYLRKSFPVKMWEEYYDEVTESTQMRPVRDSAGDIVTDPSAVARRDQLMKDLAGLPVPETVMERIINHFGSSNVAEVTGRKRRLVRQPDGTVVEERMTPSSRAKDIDSFMDKKKRILMFSDAGGTGKGYHSDLDRINQEKRIHYLVQAGWIASRALQGFGRSHRTNQRFAPHDVLVTTDVAAHKRFFSSIARRLDQVGALTKGERKTTGQGLFSAEMNLENEYADMALAVLFDDLQADRVEGLNLNTVARQMGFGDISEIEGDLISGLGLSMTRFLNRMLSMEIDEQNKLFDAFFARLEAQIQYAIDQGIY